MKRGRCIQCRRRLGSRAEFLFNRPNGARVFLCGRQVCEDKFNGVAPNERPQEITTTSGGAA